MTVYKTVRIRVKSRTAKPLRHSVSVTIYPTQRAFERAATKRGAIIVANDTTRGITFPTFFENMKTKAFRAEVHVLISAERFDVEVISHEMVHAAAHLYRAKHGGFVDCNLGPEIREEEEELAYMVGELTSAAYAKFYQKGFEFSA